MLYDVRMMHSVLIGVFCLAIGLAVGYFVAQEQVNESRRLLANVGGESEPRTEPAHPITATQVTASASKMAVTTVATDRGALFPRGTGVITGSVQDAKGNGLAHVRIKARRHANFNPRGDDTPGQLADDTLSPQELMEKHEAAMQRDPSREAFAFSDAAGAFRLEGLDAGPYEIQARLTGYTFIALGGDSPLVDRQPGDTIALRAVRLGAVRVDVRLPDGSAPAVAELTCSQVAGSSVFQWTPADSLVPLSVGAWQLHACGGVFGELKSKVASVIVGDADDPGTVELNLEERPHIRGRVVFGGPVPDQRCTVLLWSEHQDPEKTGMWEAPTVTESARWLATEGYCFPDLKPGTYRLGVSVAKEINPPVAATVLVADKGVQQDLVVTANAAPEWRIKVLDPDGLLVADAKVTTNMNGAMEHDWHHAADGSLCIRVPKYIQQGPREEPVFAFMTSGAWGNGLLEMARGGGHYELRMSPTGTLRVHFQTSPEVLESISAVLRLHPPAGSQHKTIGLRNADAQGCAEFGPLQPGTYSLELCVEGRNDRQSPSICKREVIIQSGANALQMGVPQLYTVSVRIHPVDKSEFDKRVGLNTDAKRANPTSESVHFTTQADVDAEGVAQFTNVPAGPYVIGHWAHNRYVIKMIDVPRDLDVTLNLDMCTAMRLHLYDKNADLAKLGFQDGDLLIGLEGREFKTAADVDNALRFLAAGESVAAMMQRGSKVETRPLPVKIFNESKGFSWSFVQR